MTPVACRAILVPMEIKKVFGIVLVLAGAVVGVKMLFRPSPVQAPAIQTSPIEMPARKEEPNPAPPAVSLEQSGAFIRQNASSLSSHPKLTDWLKTENLMRRIAAAVDLIANGDTPRDSLDFLNPRKRFLVKKEGKKMYVDPRSYTRYDVAADVFASLDAQGAAKLVMELNGPFQAACRELDCRVPDFKETLVRAIKGLLQTPVVSGEIRLNERVISYSMADPKLEGLNAAQKHLLRMGPQNTAKIQGKLREIAKALGLAEDQLPRSQLYSPKVL